MDVQVYSGEDNQDQKAIRIHFVTHGWLLLSNRLIVNIVPRAMDELPIRQSCSQPVNPSHVTINGLAHYCTHNASVDNSI